MSLIPSKNAPTAPAAPTLATQFAGAYTPTRAPGAGGYSQMMRQYQSAPTFGDFSRTSGRMNWNGQPTLIEGNPDVSGSGTDFTSGVAQGGLLNHLASSDPNSLVRGQQRENRDVYNRNAAGTGRANAYGSTEAEFDANGNYRGQRTQLSGTGQDLLNNAGWAATNSFGGLTGQGPDFSGVNPQGILSSGMFAYDQQAAPGIQQGQNSLDERIANRGLPINSQIATDLQGNFDRQNAIARAGTFANLYGQLPGAEATMTNTRIAQGNAPITTAANYLGLYQGVGANAPGFSSSPTLGATDVAGTVLGAGNQTITATGQALNAGQLDQSRLQSIFNNQTTNNTQRLAANAQDFGQQNTLWGQDRQAGLDYNRNLADQFGMSQTQNQNELQRLMSQYGMANSEWTNNQTAANNQWRQNFDAQNAGNQATTQGFNSQLQSYQAQQQANAQHNAQWGQLLGGAASLALMPMTGGLSGGFSNTLLGGAMGGMGLFGGGSAPPGYASGSFGGGGTYAPGGLYGSNSGAFPWLTASNAGGGQNYGYGTGGWY